jgi:hypothetical protein
MAVFNFSLINYLYFNKPGNQLPVVFESSAVSSDIISCTQSIKRWADGEHSLKLGAARPSDT